MEKHGKPQRQEIISLIATLEEVPDPRVDRSKDHDLVDLLVIALCTILVGGNSFYDMEEFAAICAKKKVTRGDETGLRKLVVVPKVGVTRHAQRNESKNEARSDGTVAA